MQREFQLPNVNVLWTKWLLKLGYGSKNISYSGRVQLVNSMLMSVHGYWAQIFILPTSVIKAIWRCLQSLPLVWESVFSPRVVMWLGLSCVRAKIQVGLVSGMWKIGTYLFLENMSKTLQKTRIVCGWYGCTQFILKKSSGRTIILPMGESWY